MLKKNLLMTVLLLFTIGLFAQKSIDFSIFEKRQYEKNGVVLPYRIMYPEQMKKGEKYPLVLMLHGMGRCGNDNEGQLNLGGTMFMNKDNRNNFPCIVIYPQAPKTTPFVRVNEEGGDLPGGWQKFDKEGIKSKGLSVELSEYGEMAFELVEQLRKSKNVDNQRIYIAGVSMGAFTTYQLIAKHPDVFAAAITICGATPLNCVEEWGNKVPIWIFHGEKDKVVPVDAARGVYDKLEKMGVENYKYTESLLSR